MDLPIRFPVGSPNRKKYALMMRLLTQLFRQDDGQDLIEYALLAAFVSLVATAAITFIGVRVNSWYEGYAATVSTIPGGGS
jgi:Flp pilus assembly pilin Flp